MKKKSYAELGELFGLNEKTIVNVIGDLKMFGIATVESSKIKLADSMEASDQDKLLQRIRHVLRSHALTMRLSRLDPGEIITTQNIIDLLKQINPTAQHQEKTWKVYAEKMVKWLSVTGYLVQKENNWKFEDQGKVNLENINVNRKTGRKMGGITIFIGDASPIKAIEALDYLRNNQPLSSQEMEEKDFRNALAVLRALDVVTHELGRYSIAESTQHESKSSLEIVWDAACSEKTIKSVIDYLKNHPTADGRSVGGFISQEYKRDWSAGSERRIGNSLRQWTIWVLTGIQQKQIPKPPGRTEVESEKQLSLFEEE